MIANWNNPETFEECLRIEAYWVQEMYGKLNDEQKQSIKWAFQGGELVGGVSLSKGIADLLKWNTWENVLEQRRLREVESETSEYPDYSVFQSSSSFRKPEFKPYEPPKRDRSGHIYLLRAIHDSTLFKIGRAKDPNDRLKTFNVKLPFPIEYDCLVQTDDMYALESNLHAKFASKRLDGEWFRLEQEDVEYIRSLVKE